MDTRTSTNVARRPSRLFVPALALALWADALGAQPTPRWEVPVYVLDDGQAPPLTLSHARVVASQIFAAAGVNLHWHAGPAPANYETAQGCPALNDRPVVIQIDFAPPHNLPVSSLHTLAYTFPYSQSGARIYVLYERLHSMFPASPRLSGTLLGHVMAHEIAHVLQRIDRHSDSGVMKARWTTRDYSAMESHPLPFEDADLVLIRLGLESWTRKACPAANAPAPGNAV